MSIKIALAQINFFVGDIVNNINKITNYATAACLEQAQIIIFPELALSGYPPEDFLLRQDFLQKLTNVMPQLLAASKNIDIIVGTPWLIGNNLYNSALYLSNKKILAIYKKQYLPNYGVFDEKRYFHHGKEICIVQRHGINIGLMICEDLWHQAPADAAMAAGAECLISINASPYDHNKPAQRLTILHERQQTAPIPIIYVQSVGAQDECIFDGGSLAVNKNGKIVFNAPYFSEGLFYINYKNTDLSAAQTFMPPSQEQLVYEALCFGLRDYAQKNNFTGALVGLSGGIDSALTLAIACDALGAAQVTAIALPSRHTSDDSMNLLMEQINLLGVAYNILSIEPIYQTLLTTLQPYIDDNQSDLTHQNLQARARGILLMALSNHSGKLLLTTGNKSEMAVGYATLYGDMAGGFAVLKDVYKTWIYRLANYRNSKQLVIPQGVISRAPSAELAPNQKDEDSLPPYDILDKILAAYIEAGNSSDQILSLNIAPLATIEKIIRLVHRAEYKRRQSAPGIKITTCAFGRERRYPISQGFI